MKPGRASRPAGLPLKGVTMQHIKKSIQELTDKLARLVSRDASDEVTELVITEVDPPGKLTRCWVTGYIERHAFEALLYPRHAIWPEIELRRSRISKLCLRELASGQIVAVFERGWGLPPTTETAREVVDYLASVLAFRVYGHLRQTYPTIHRLGSN
jgi:hypothetical protein